jgi:hypothetical protein
MVDPLTTAIATSVVGKIAETLTVQGQEAIAGIGKRLRERFHGKPAEIAALDQAISETEPEGSFAVESLARAMEREFTADPRFRDEIHALWWTVAQEKAPSGAVNSFSGVAKTVTQIAGDFRGDITIS